MKQQGFPLFVAREDSRLEVLPQSKRELHVKGPRTNIVDLLMQDEALEQERLRAVQLPRCPPELQRQFAEADRLSDALSSLYSGANAPSKPVTHLVELRSLSLINFTMCWRCGMCGHIVTDQEARGRQAARHNLSESRLQDWVASFGATEVLQQGWQPLQAAATEGGSEKEEAKQGQEGEEEAVALGLMALQTKYSAPPPLPTAPDEQPAMPSQSSEADGNGPSEAAAKRRRVERRFKLPLTVGPPRVPPEGSVVVDSVSEEETEVLHPSIPDSSSEEAVEEAGTGFPRARAAEQSSANPMASWFEFMRNNAHWQCSERCHCCVLASHCSLCLDGLWAVDDGTGEVCVSATGKAGEQLTGLSSEQLQFWSKIASIEGMLEVAGGWRGGGSTARLQRLTNPFSKEFLSPFHTVAEAAAFLGYDLDSARSRVLEGMPFPLLPRPSHQPDEWTPRVAVAIQPRKRQPKKGQVGGKQFPKPLEQQQVDLKSSQLHGHSAIVRQRPRVVYNALQVFRYFPVPEKE